MKSLASLNGILAPFTLGVSDVFNTRSYEAKKAMLIFNINTLFHYTSILKYLNDNKS